MDIKTQIKRSSLNYKHEKLACLVNNLPVKKEIDKLLKRSPKQRAIYEKLCKGKTTIAVLAKEIPASSEVLKSLRKKGLIENCDHLKRRILIPMNSKIQVFV